MYGKEQHSAVFEENDRPVAFVKKGSDRAVTELIAGVIGVCPLYCEQRSDHTDYSLTLSEEGLSLCAGDLSLRADFTKMLPRLKKNNLRGELLARAAKIKPDSFPFVIDATAGLGEDALVLAACGCRVMMYERDRTIAALLRDALRRAVDNEQLKSIVCRMTLCEADSLSALPHLCEPPEIVYLDPMFPQKQKNSLTKKKFQLLHFLEKPADDEEELVNAAFSAHPRKIIVKRPAKGPYLAGVKPSYSIEGKGIRYDCIVT